MADLIFPTNSQLSTIAQTKLPELERNREIFKFFPMQTRDTHLVEWEQKDNYTGLMQVRGLNGQPGRVQPIGFKRFAIQPGVYGEYIPIDEIMLTTRRQFGSFNQPVNINDLVMEAQDKLIGRRLDRIEQIGWALVVAGTFSVSQNSVLLHTDTYTTQTFDATVGWGTPATSTPLADFRAVQLLARGLSVDFGTSAVAYMNRVTFNRMMSNTNAADLGGRRLAGLMPVNGPVMLNQLMNTDGLPTISVYDAGYLNDAGTFTLFIPDNKVVVLGARRDNDPIGAFIMTRNANNPGFAPGPYMWVIDTIGKEVPRTVQVHDGLNGGPVLYHPSAIVVMDVS